MVDAVVEYTLDQIRRGVFLDRAIIGSSYIQKFVDNGYCKSKEKCYVEDIYENLNKKNGLYWEGKPISLTKVFFGNALQYASGFDTYYTISKTMFDVGMPVPDKIISNPLPRKSKK